MIWGRVLTLLAGLVFWTAASAAQSSLSDLSQATQIERQALVAGGYPLFDTSGQLSQSERAALLSQLEELQTCCDLHISLVLQKRPLNLTADQDLEILLGQLQVAELWTDQSLVILLQSEPMESLAIRAEPISNRTQSLGARELQALGNAVANGQATDALIQALNALSADLDAENLSLGFWTLGRTAQEALYHFCTFWLVGCLSVAIFWSVRRESTLPRPALLRVIRTHPVSFKDFSFGHMQGGMDVVFARQSRAPRHWFALLIFSLFAGFVSVFFLEPAFWGLDGVWEDWQLWALVDSWVARAVLNLGLVFALFVILGFSPLGAWISQGSLSRTRQSQLLAQRLQSYPDISRVTVVLVWRRVSRRLEIWEPAHAALANPRMDTLLDRLEADFNHGEAEIGMRRFLDQYDRLMQSRGGAEGTGKIAELRV